MRSTPTSTQASRKDHPSSKPMPPWSLQLSEATILQPALLSLRCFKSFLPNEYLVCGLFGLRHIHLHFSMMIRSFVPAFPIFLIPLDYSFAYAGVYYISPFRIICEFHFQAPSHSLRLIKTGLSEMGGKASFLYHPPKPTLWSQPSVLRAVSFHPAHFSIHVTGWAAKMICLHLCHISGPFINCQSSEFTDGTSVPVSFYAGATPQRKGFALSSRATWQIVVSLICTVWKHNPLSPTLWEITFPFHTPELF